MGKVFDSNFIEDSYIVYLCNNVKKYNLQNILDFGQGCSGKTSFYIYQYLNTLNRNITSICTDQWVKDGVLRQLEIDELEGSFIKVVPTKTDENGNYYDIDWKQFNNKFNVISIDAPAIGDIVPGHARVDIINIIQEGMLDMNKYFIMFHDIDNEEIMKTIIKVKTILGCNVLTYNSYIVLTNIKGMK